MAQLTDVILLIHALALFILAAIILRAAYKKHQSRMWLMWPPLLLISWFATTFLEGLIFLRRGTERQVDWQYIQYESVFTFGLNVLSSIVIVILIYQIFRGDSVEESKDRRDRRQDARADRQDEQQALLDENAIISNTRNKVLSEAGAELDVIRLGIDTDRHDQDARSKQQDARQVCQDTREHDQDVRDEESPQNPIGE